jgi:hypothetical protein
VKRFSELSAADKRRMALRADTLRMLDRAELAAQALADGRLDGPGGAIELAGEIRGMIRKLADLRRLDP